MGMLPPQKRFFMATLDSVPLFLHSQKFSEVKAKLSFYDYAEIGYVSRIIELANAIFCLCTLSPTAAWEHCQNAWAGYKGALKSFDPAEVHQWKLLLKTNLQKQFYLESKEWKEVLTVCPETFEFAPPNVKRDQELVTLAVTGNAAMIQFMDQTLLKQEAFVKQLGEKNPRVTIFLDPTHKKVIMSSWTAELEAKTKCDSGTDLYIIEREQLEYIIQTCNSVWQACLKTSGARFLYLRHTKVGSPHTIQVFNDGKVWIHVSDYDIGKGRLKRVRSITEMGTKRQFAKLSALTKGQSIVLGGNEKLKKEIVFHEMFKGLRGIVQLVDTFEYPTKGVTKWRGEQKTVLMQERYSRNINQVNENIWGKWTEADLQKLTLDLLYGLKAFKDYNVYDGDFNFGNVLLQLDEEGHVLKAGFNDFEEAEILTEKSPKDFKDPLDADYEIQNKIIGFLKGIYSHKKLQFPEILEEGFYKKKGSVDGLSTIALKPTKTLEEIIAGLGETK